MNGVCDVVVVKELECLFVGGEADVESRIMCIFMGIMGFEVWDRG